MIPEDALIEHQDRTPAYWPLDDTPSPTIEAGDRCPTCGSRSTFGHWDGCPRQERPT